MKMISTQIMALAAIVGSLLLMMSSGPYELDAAEMANVRGGVWCSTPVPDPAGLDCNECTSNGNGWYVKCTPDTKDWMHQYTVGQTPAQLWSYPEYSCNGFAHTYSNSTCTNFKSSTTCLRTYTGASFGGGSMVVICP